MIRSYKVKKQELGNVLTTSLFYFSIFFDHVDAALHVEILLGHIVMFAIQNFFETADCFRNRNILALIAGENLCHVEGLAKEPLNLACALNSNLVLRAQFIHSENRDDVLKIFVTLQHSLHTSSDVVMFFTDDFRSERF